MVLVACMAAGTAGASPAADTLEQEIERITARIDAVVGVHVRHLETGAERGFQAQLSFPMASTYKVAIGACALRQVDRGKLSLDTLVAIEPRQRSTSSVLSDHFRWPGLTVSLHNLLELMLTQSDNTATDVILEAIGGPAAVQSCLAEAGLQDMRVDRSTAQILRQYGGVPEPSEPAVSFHEQFLEMMARSAASAYFLDGSGAPYLAFERDPRDHATPYAMTRLLTILWQDEWLSAASGAVLREILGRSREPVRLGRGLPAGTPLAHKTGTLSGTVNDTGVIELPSRLGHLVVTVYVKNARGPHEPVEAVIGEIARAIYDDYVRPPDAGRFERSAQCPFAMPERPLRERLVCGELEVPERHDQPAGPRVRLPVVIVRSANGNSRPDPVVFLAGGPGAAPLESVRTIERFAQHPFGIDRDIILFNQRGSMQTQPALACVTAGESRTAIHADDLTLEQRDARIAATVVGCLEELRSQGRDLEAYAAAGVAADLRALREALGIRQWNLLAVSYGTWMALAAARVDPDGVRSMLLDSVMSRQSDLFMSESSRNFSLGVDRLLAACRADTHCATAFPDLGERLRRVIRDLDEHPVNLRVAGATDGAVVDVIVNWHDFLSVVHWMLYNTSTLRLLPLLIDQTSRGELNLLGRLMESVYPGTRAGAPGPSAAFFTIVCNDQYTKRNPLPAAPGNAAYRGFSIVSFMPEVCRRTTARPESKPAPERLQSPVPTLLLSGHFDPMTPDRYATELAADLERVLRVAIPDSGHSTLSDFAACQTAVAQDFLDTLDTSRPHDCLNQARPPQFVLSPDEAVRMLSAR